MTAVLDPDALTGFHSGPIHYSTEDGRFYVLTDDGAIPADGPRDATTLDADLLAMVGADHFTLRDGQLDMIRPASPNTAAYEDTMIGLHYPGGLSLMNASGTSRLRNRLVLNFLSGGSLDPRITFTRASSATRVNSSGLIETVSSDVARFDYDPVTLAAKGLLIEEQRTNLLLRSQEFDNASWVKTRATVTANAATAPDGAITADKLVEDSTAAASHYISQLVASHTSGATYTVSAYAKAGERSQIRVNGDATIGLISPAIFDLSSGTVTSSGGFTTTSMIALGNGWYRCIATGTATATAVGVWVLGLAVAGSTSYTGDGTSGIYLWGAQLEAGAFATSYIPTTSATVTRAADVASITGTNFSDWFNSSEGTFVVEADANDSATNKPLLGASDGTTSNRLLAYVNGAGSNHPSFLVTSGGVAQAATTSATVANGAIFKFACAYKANDFASSLNGAAAVADVSGTVPTGLVQLEIGRFGVSGTHLNGHIRRLTYYPARLSNALLQSLTA